MKVIFCFALFAFAATQADRIYRTLPVTSTVPRSLIYSTPDVVSSPAVLTYSAAPAPVVYRSTYQTIRSPLYARTTYTRPTYVSSVYSSPVYKNQIIYKDVPTVYSTIPSAGHVITYGAHKTE